MYFHRGRPPLLLCHSICYLRPFPPTCSCLLGPYYHELLALLVGRAILLPLKRVKPKWGATAKRLQTTDPGFQPWVSWFTRRALKASSTPRSRGAIRGGRASPRAARTFPTQRCISRPRLQDVLSSADKRIARTRSLPDPPRCCASRVAPDVGVRCRITTQTSRIPLGRRFQGESSDIPTEG